jgi:hypothetical protein
MVIDPVQTVVEEIVPPEVRRVVDRIARDRNEVRIGTDRQVDATAMGFEAHDDLRGCRRCDEGAREREAGERTNEMTHGALPIHRGGGLRP